MKKRISLLLGTLIAVIVWTLATGCAALGGHETTGQRAVDKEIADNVKSALHADPTTKGSDIRVQSLQGVVALSGFIDSQAAKDRAGQIASSTTGVVQVYNNLLLPTGRH
jgi:osmotically-inducible protein OsmY